MSGRAAQTSTRPASNAILVPNSVVCGAIRSTEVAATRNPNSTRPTRPFGTVFGSVIMKNRKISTSGEVTIARQKATPHTGVKAQRAVMQCPAAASNPTPIARDTQNTPAMARSWSRLVISSPPVRMTT